MIKGLIRALLINSVGLFLASQLISGFHLSYGIHSIFIVAVAFTAIHIFVKPLLNLFLGPINLLTLGLVSLAIDTAILYSLSVFLPQISFSNWQFIGVSSSGIVIPPYNFNPIGSTIISAILINLVRSALNFLAS